MPVKVLAPTDLSRESNSVLPWAVTIAQAFPNKLYLLHTMHPSSVKKPERLEDFPSLSAIFAMDRDKGFRPPLKGTVPVAKMYEYHKDPAQVILARAHAKKIDLICMAVTRQGTKLAWWSAGKTVERVVRDAPCSVLCVQGRALKEEQWQRPHFRQVLLVAELGANGAAALAKVTPWIKRFNSILHIFPLATGELAEDAEQTAIRDLCLLESVLTNVLLFPDPDNRMANLFKFMTETPVDLIVMAPRARAKFSNRIVRDVFVRLLRLTNVPILLLR